MRMTIKQGGIKIKCVIFCHYCDIGCFEAGFLNNSSVFHWSGKQNCPNSCHWLSQCWAGPDVLAKSAQEVEAVPPSHYDWLIH